MPVRTAAGLPQTSGHILSPWVGLLSALALGNFSSIMALQFVFLLSLVSGECGSHILMNLTEGNPYPQPH